MRPSRTLMIAALAAVLGIPMTVAGDASRGGPPDSGRTGRTSHAPHSHGQAAENRDSGGWTKFPLVFPARGQRGGDRLAAEFSLRNIQAPTVEVWRPDAPDTPVRWTVANAPDGARAGGRVKTGNYHWVTAREATPNHVGVASTVHYVSDRGPAPTALLRKIKGGLEIVPKVLPREHASYREKEEWVFLVRFDGRPLPGKRVVMETEPGSRIVFTSDERGEVRVTFPRDMRPAPPAEGNGHGAPRRGRFVLAAEHLDQEKHYVTAFNSVYSPDPSPSRSLWLGAGFGVAGMLLALPLFRRRNAAGSVAKEKN